MALNARRSWLIAYDIADPGRLNRVHRYLKGEAVPIQYSIFATNASANGIRRVHDALAMQIDPRRDDVRIYLLPQSLDISGIGSSFLPEGLLLPNHASLA
ncbi:CRISPR-associated endonuclease Cas2 [Acidiferrobacter sp. SPIII_3]|jgi:CRISPR-associated endoribonuclease Cas2|uniref:CRISPR-associated endonuclease Cas2 n=1 Tax=Acidiferrobacter sp. SPIII_3 TaxID=1281578 RepID=UPI000D730535|nr:CRISPR-associated endonuclease Cas2 [Acidiferrobacter sp. SPIII_3]AWP22295.1 CRISPR-associated endonuclease Cas2 [Acidiferrobacter sp. SPIII_3]